MNINGHTSVLGIIGNPISHTLSPRIHNMISDSLSINAVYVPFRANDDVKTMVSGLYSLGVRGVNVTVPYKTEVMYELCGVDPLAQEIGAVNTLKYTENGYYGYNTDIIGLDRELSDEHVILTGRHILIIGAGGAARAVAFLCASKNPASITIINRTLSKALAIQQDIISYAGRNGMYELANNIFVTTYKEVTGLPYTEYIAFQCTNIGLSPNDDACVIHDREFYKRISTGIDLIYKPSETLFMKYVKSLGGEAYNGLKMLVYQAVSAYEIWNDVTVPEMVIYDIEKELA